MNNITLNLLLGFSLFIINGLIGRLQYCYRNIFEYQFFSFSINSDGNLSGNFFQMIINPSVYITLLCVILQAIDKTELSYYLWQVVLFYWLTRLIYIVLKGQWSLVNWWYEIISFIISIVLSNFILFKCLIPLINAEKSVFISLETLRDTIWIAILSYVLKITWDICKSILAVENIHSADRKYRVVWRKYVKYNNNYDNIIESILNEFPKEIVEYSNLRQLIYAVMIYEDYNRPYIYRKIENLLKKIFPCKAMTLGIMQVSTYKCINDNESIKIGARKLINAYIENIDDCPIEKALYFYNSSEAYQSEVFSIYNMLIG